MCTHELLVSIKDLIHIKLELLRLLQYPASNDENY